MSTHRGAIQVACLAICLIPGAAFSDGPNLGRPVDQADIAAWDISIEPDGTGLPPGAGTPGQRAPIFAAKCALCHGPDGEAELQA
jgi:S-disulfanyl-L-cysteine oxidoreductase SoxD